MMPWLLHEDRWWNTPGERGFFGVLISALIGFAFALASFLSGALTGAELRFALEAAALSAVGQ